MDEDRTDEAHDAKRFRQRIHHPALKQLRSRCIEMRKGKLAPHALPDRKFFDVRRFERVEYPFERAVENFLQHGGGVSDAARRALLALINDARVRQNELRGLF